MRLCSTVHEPTTYEQYIIHSAVDCSTLLLGYKKDRAAKRYAQHAVRLGRIDVAGKEAAPATASLPSWTLPLLTST